jgi:hypothetical protein
VFADVLNTRLEDVAELSSAARGDEMSDWLKALGEMSPDNVFVIVGLVFLGIAVVGKISGKIDAKPHARAISAMLGACLVLSGVWIHRGHVIGRGTISPSPSAAVIPPVSTQVHAQEDPVQAAKIHSTANQPHAAGLSYFSGTWKNTDTKTRGLTTVHVRTAGESVWVRAWGACHPTDCDWGEVPGNAFAPGASTDPVSSAQKVTALFETSFSNTLLTLSQSDDDELEADTQTHFTDNSGRSSYSASYTFRH